MSQRSKFNRGVSRAVDVAGEELKRRIRAAWNSDSEQAFADKIAQAMEKFASQCLAELDSRTWKFGYGEARDNQS